MRLLLLAALVGAVAAAAASEPALPGKAGDRDELFDKIDANHDGIIDKKEFGADSPASGFKGALGKLAKGAGFVPAFLNSITMIIATELGDKTFCIAAVMAMRYNRLFVFTGSIAALIVMTVLSVVIGVAVPALLSKTYTHYAAAALFAYFGYKLLREASTMSGGAVSEELAEAEAELSSTMTGSSTEAGSTVTPRHNGAEGAEAGHDGVTAPRLHDTPRAASEAGGDVEEADPGAKNSITKRARETGGNGNGSSWMRDWPILTQAFTLTFLAEWGDRSQIATIAMASAQEPYGIAFGGFIGHSLCTGLAVIGGRLLASRISEKAVATVGGILFLLFALHSVVVGPEVDE